MIYQNNIMYFQESIIREYYYGLLVFLSVNGELHLIASDNNNVMSNIYIRTLIVVHKYYIDFICYSYMFYFECTQSTWQFIS